MKNIVKRLKEHLSSLDNAVASASKSRKNFIYKFIHLGNKNTLFLVSAVLVPPIFLSLVTFVFNSLMALSLSIMPLMPVLFLLLWSGCLMVAEEKALKVMYLKKGKKENIIKNINIFLDKNKDSLNEENINLFEIYLSKINNKDIPSYWWNEFLKIISSDDFKEESLDLINTKNKLNNIKSNFFVNENDIAIYAKNTTKAYEDKL